MGLPATLVMLLIAALASGCGSIYYGQVPVPNTNQRLIVGHDSWPSKQIWVIEGGKVDSVRIVEGDRK
jgi:hypothetical protein